MKKITIGIFIFLLFLQAGCAPQKVWTSNPTKQITGNNYYEVLLEPVREDHYFFVMFKISVTNKTNKDLEIDWNKTRYIYNGKLHGGFAFEGIGPENVKNNTIPPDKIAAGSVFVKEIAPIKLIAWAPIRDSSVREGETGISPGKLPAGENGVLLFVRQDGQEIRQNVTVNLKYEEIK